jgi:hypothetical protein
MSKAQATLSTYHEGDASVKLLSTVLGALPWVEAYRHRQSTVSETMDDAMNVAEAMAACGLVSGGFATAFGVMNLINGRKKHGKTFDATTFQATDAALKGLCMAYIVNKTMTGTVREKVKQFVELPEGRQMLAYYLAVEIALPFADDFAVAASGLLKDGGVAAVDKFKKLLPGKADQADSALAVFGEMKSYLTKFAEQTGEYAVVIREKAVKALPTALDVAGSATDLAATAADMLPVWPLLTARLVAAVEADAMGRMVASAGEVR